MEQITDRIGSDRHALLAADETDSDWMQATEARLREIEAEIAKHLESRRQHPPHNVNQRYYESFSRLDRLKPSRMSEALPHSR